MKYAFPGAGLGNEQICVRLHHLPQWLHLSVTPPIACRLFAPPHFNSDWEEIMRPKHKLMLIGITALMALPVAARAPGEFSPPARTFQFTYQVTLKDLPSGAQR